MSRRCSISSTRCLRTTLRRFQAFVFIREEGLAERFLEINGVWEDHVRYGFTIEEWQQRRDQLSAEWLQ